MRRKAFRWMFAAMILVGGGSLVGYVLQKWLVFYLVPQMDGASVGIIGGADGPTAIFVTSTAVPALHYVGILVLLAAGIWGLARFPKNKS